MTDEIEKLKHVVAEELKRRKILGKLKAQLRKTVLSALEETDPEKQIYGENPKLREVTATDRSTLLADLVQEFLIFYDLDYSNSVYTAEATLKQSTPNRSKLSSALKVKNNTSQPLLLTVLNGFLSGEPSDDATISSDAPTVVAGQPQQQQEQRQGSPPASDIEEEPNYDEDFEANSREASPQRSDNKNNDATWESQQQPSSSSNTKHPSGDGEADGADDDTCRSDDWSMSEHTVDEDGMDCLPSHYRDVFVENERDEVFAVDNHHDHDDHEDEDNEFGELASGGGGDTGELASGGDSAAGGVKGWAPPGGKLGSMGKSLGGGASAEVAQSLSGGHEGGGGLLGLPGGGPGKKRGALSSMLGWGNDDSF